MAFIATWRRHPWRFATLVVCSGVGGLLIALASVVPFRSETARRKVIEILSQRLQAQVELEDLNIRLLPTFHAEGRRLTIRHHGRHDVPPLITVETIAADATLWGVLHRHLARVVLKPLEIVIPPDRNRVAADSSEPVRSDSRGVVSPDAAATTTSAPGIDDTWRATTSKLLRVFVIDELVSDQARLTIMPNDHGASDAANERTADPGRDDAAGGRPGRVWEIRRLRMQSVSVDGSFPFAATIENAIPPGNIETFGSFGPWQPDEPGSTRLEGRFTLDHADLGVFKGISGILSAKGTFGGTLQRIEARGETDTPDFSVDIAGHAVRLRAAYSAVVDGTNGNTRLDSINASFLNTSLRATGGVVRTPGARGRTVTLDVSIDEGRIEDVMQLAVKDQPPMTGSLKTMTTLVLPPGDRDVVDKLRLTGWFTIAGAGFTSGGVQKKINELSRRTRGTDSDEKAERVLSKFAGRFTLSESQLSLAHVAFDVPGSAVRLAGTYGLTSEKIDFAGTIFTEARISEMTTGFKSLLLKPVDLIFRRRGGGSEIPIAIKGTRDAPAYGLDRRRVFNRH